MTLFFWKSYIGHQTAAAVYPNVSRHLYQAVSQSVNPKKKEEEKKEKRKQTCLAVPHYSNLFVHVLGQNSLFYVAEKFSKCSMVTKYLALICHRYYHDRRYHRLIILSYKILIKLPIYIFYFYFILQGAYCKRDTLLNVT